MRRYRIGRSDTNDIVIAHASVSRQHAELVAHDDGRHTLSDLGSSYGTSVRQGTDWVAAAE
ncbi:MAG: FHA domain-containing protein, partial [Rhodospirillaceae bacterium]|nr:FHA domain-containing protein [Rhodospirillaceae bacterium]